VWCSRAGLAERRGKQRIVLEAVPAAALVEEFMLEVASVRLIPPPVWIDRFSKRNVSRCATWSRRSVSSVAAAGGG